MKSPSDACALQFKDSLFRITTTRDSSTIVVAHRFLAELQKLPDDVISMEAAVSEVFGPPPWAEERKGQADKSQTIEAKHTKLAPESSYATSHTIKTSLTPSLGKDSPCLSVSAAPPASFPFSRVY